jgi:hypothetical protein
MFFLANRNALSLNNCEVLVVADNSLILYALPRLLLIGTSPRHKISGERKSIYFNHKY